MPKKRVVAMLLAGGHGSRLGILTRNMAKPAVPFGGKYRIIDFPLSNCANSDIDTVGVLTQYQPLELNAYIGTGSPWDLDRTDGGVHILPPYQRNQGADWYTGTANAITQNISFIEQYEPEYVIILSGDHIYKMNYDNVISFHRKTCADCTIAVLEVPWEETSRFGIMNTDADNRIVEFEEKPKHAKSNKASMGIYVFTWTHLRKALLRDEEDSTSSNDFGKNIIPTMLAEGSAMSAYPFSGYWKDVGTIESLWEANMDLLEEQLAFDLYDPKWRIYNRNPVQPPHYVAPGAVVEGAMVTEGAVIEGTVRHSIIFAGVRVESGAVVEDSVVMPWTRIKAGAHVKRAIIAEQTFVGENCVIGGESGDIAVVGDHVSLTDGLKVAPGEQLDAAALAARMERGESACPKHLV